MTRNRQRLGRVPSLEPQKFFKFPLALIHVRMHVHSFRVKSTCEIRLGLSGPEVSGER